MPIHIGGHSKAAARPAGRPGDGVQPLGVGGQVLNELIGIMRDEVSKSGRDPDSPELSPGHLVTKIDSERAEKLAAFGASRVVLAMPTTTDIDEARDMLSVCADRPALTR